MGRSVVWGKRARGHAPATKCLKHRGPGRSPRRNRNCSHCHPPESVDRLSISHLLRLMGHVWRPEKPQIKFPSGLHLFGVDDGGKGVHRRRICLWTPREESLCWRVEPSSGCACAQELGLFETFSRSLLSREFHGCCRCEAFLYHTVQMYIRKNLSLVLWYGENQQSAFPSPTKARQR